MAKIKREPITDVRSELINFIGFLKDTGQGSISPGKVKLAERQALERAIARLGISTDGVIDAIERSSGPDHAREHALLSLWNALASAYTIGSEGTLSANSKVAAASAQADRARGAKDQRRQEDQEFQIIKRVVDQRRGPGDEKRPWKFGRAMLDDVNRALGAAGLDPLKRCDKLARYLESLQSSPHP
jgi:hypothetical protein